MNTRPLCYEAPWEVGYKCAPICFNITVTSGNFREKKPKPVFCSQDVIRRQFFEIPKPNKQGWASGAAAGTIMIG